MIPFTSPRRSLSICIYYSSREASAGPRGFSFIRSKCKNHVHVGFAFLRFALHKLFPRSRKSCCRAYSRFSLRIFHRFSVCSIKKKINNLEASNSKEALRRARFIVNEAFDSTHNTLNFQQAMQPSILSLWNMCSGY